MLHPILSPPNTPVPQAAARPQRSRSSPAASRPAPRPRRRGTAAARRSAARGSWRRSRHRRSWHPPIRPLGPAGPTERDAGGVEDLQSWRMSCVRGSKTPRCFHGARRRRGLLAAKQQHAKRHQSGSLHQICQSASDQGKERASTEKHNGHNASGVAALSVRKLTKPARHSKALQNIRLVTNLQHQ